MVHRVRLKLQKSLDLWHFSLTKAAVYGRDPNWGRIACAAGYAGVSFDPNKLRISLREILLMDEGQPLSFDRSCILFLLVLFQTFLQVMMILDSSISSACKVFEEFSELISSRNCKIFLISKELSIWLSL